MCSFSYVSHPIEFPLRHPYMLFAFVLGYILRCIFLPSLLSAAGLMSLWLRLPCALRCACGSMDRPPHESTRVATNRKVCNLHPLFDIAS